MTKRSFSERFSANLERQLARGREPNVAIRAAARATGGRVVDTERQAQAQTKQILRLVAFLAHERGTSYARIGRANGVHPSTAVEWCRLGAKAWAEDPAGCRRELVERFGVEFVQRMAPVAGQDGGTE